MSEAATPRISLALSGGGSRAIAFHLGCLRALKQLGLLDRVIVLSTVSGGSLIGSYSHAHQGHFPSFKAKIRELLTHRLVAPMQRKLFTAALGGSPPFFVAGVVALGVALIKALFNVVNLIRHLRPHPFARGHLDEPWQTDSRIIDGPPDSDLIQLVRETVDHSFI